MKSQFVIIVLCFFSLSYAQDLDLHISKCKNNFLEHEPIWIKVQLKNSSNEDIHLNISLAPEGDFLKVNLKDQIGNLMQYKGLKVTLKGELPTCILQPMSDMSISLDLNDYFGERDYPITSRYYLPVGSYSLNCELIDRKKSVSSNELKIDVVEPTGNEKLALELFESSTKIWIFEGDHEKAISKYREILIEYPNSVYSELIYYHIYARYQLGLRDYQKVIDIGEEFMKKHPTSPYAVMMVSRIAGALESIGVKDQIEAKLSKISKDFKDINPEITQESIKIIKRYKEKKY